MRTARETIDSIITKLKSESFNQLIIVIQYGKTSVDFYNHLEILERCLNGVVDSSVMLIINKVPNEAGIKRALKENPNFNLDNNLKRLRDEIARIFKFRFSAEFSLVEELDDEDDERENDSVLDKIRNVINLSEPYRFENAKTWSELVKIVEDSKKNSHDQATLNIQIKIDLKDQIEKIGSNIYSLEMAIKWLSHGQAAVVGVGTVVAFTKLKFLTPLITSGNNKLTEYKEEKLTQVNRLKEEKSRKEERLASFEIDNAKLNEEIEEYRMEIARLQKLLREN